MSDFLKIHQDGMEILGFWSELFSATVKKSIEKSYNTEVIREWCVESIVPYSNKFLIKWGKRVRPLTNEELEEDYGRTDF